MRTSPLFLLFIAFLVLRLCDVIDWSYWLVCSPLYLWLILVVAFAILSASDDPKSGSLR